MAPYLEVVGALADRVLTNTHAMRMMDYQNEYNEPVKQVQRLHAAGLSPWSYSGEGNTSAQPVYNNSGSLAESISRANSNQIAKRQVEVQENLSKAQANREESQARVNDTLAETNRVLLKYLPESEQQRIRSMSSQSDYTERQTARYDEQVDQNIANQKSQEALNYANSDRARADIKRINRLLPHEVGKIIAETDQIRENIGVLKTQADLNNAQISNTVSMFIKNMEEVDKIGLENWMMKYQKSIIEKTGIKPGTPPWTALTDMFARIRHDLGKKTMNPGSW